MSRRKPCLKNRVDPTVEEAVVTLALEQPAFGQLRIANAERVNDYETGTGSI